MSWTSEFEPPPPRPFLEPDDFSERGFELVQLGDEVYDSEADRSQEAHVAEPDAEGGDRAEAHSSDNAGSFPDDGPLDPSVFDGLFDDLDEQDERDEHDHHDELTDEATADIQSGPAESDIADSSAAESDVADSSAAESDADRDGDGDAISDQGAITGEVAEAYHADDDLDENFEQSLDEYYETDTGPVDESDHLTSADPQAETDERYVEEREPFVEHRADPDDRYEVVDEYQLADDGELTDLDDDVIESSEDLIHEVIQQHPEAAEPLPEYQEPAPFEPDELAEMDAAFEQDARRREPESFERATSIFNPGLEADPEADILPEPDLDFQIDGRSEADGQPGFIDAQGAVQSHVATGYPNQVVPQQSPAEPYPNLAEPAPLPPVVHYDPGTNDQLLDREHVGPSLYQPGDPQVIAVGKPPRRWPAFAVATVIGASLGIAGALVLFQFFRPASPELTAPAPETPVRTSVTEAPESTVEGNPLQAVGLANLAATGRFELNTIRFVPGTADLTEDSDAMLVEAAEAIAGRPTAPLSIYVRTFSEPTAIANRELSGRQGLRIQERLAELGVPISSMLVNPLGAAPLNEVQPVQTFVVPSSGLEPSDLRTAAQQVNPFAIGLDPVTNQLRPESIVPLTVLGQELAENEATTLSLAAYSYSGAADSWNQEMASVAAEAAAAYLVTNHNIDRSRVSILTPGQTPYAIGAALGGHVFVQWGDGAAINRELESLDLASVSFAPGSARLTPEATGVLDDIAAIGTARQVTLVIGVHTATESTETANADLSLIQAQTILDYLGSAGLDAQNVQVYGSGTMRQFNGQDLPSRIVITAVP